MKKALMVSSALVIVLALILAFSVTASAEDIYPRVWDNGAFVDICGGPADGDIIFEYGWVARNQFCSPPAGYWLGIYDVTNSHYVWAYDKPFNKPAPRWLTCFGTGKNLAPGDYCINFFVRSDYGTDPYTNIAVVQNYFTIPY